MKNSLLCLLEACSDEAFGQEAVEWAILSGHLPLTYDLQADLIRIMGPPGFPELGEYDALCAAYRQYSAAMADVADVLQTSADLAA